MSSLPLNTFYQIFRGFIFSCFEVFKYVQLFIMVLLTFTIINMNAPLTFHLSTLSGNASVIRNLSNVVFYNLISGYKQDYTVIVKRFTIK
jgi:uncharacterized protein with ParB-like and HNH nuclease domain